MSAPIDVAALRAVYAAATQGPVEAWQNTHAEPLVSKTGRRYFGLVATPNHGQEDYGFADAEFIAAAYNHFGALLDALEERTVTDAAGRDGLPIGSVVRSSAGTIASRFDRDHGVVFGISQPISWFDLELPLTVLHTPEESS